MHGMDIIMKKLFDRKSLWQAGPEELMSGYYEDDDSVYCLICNEHYTKGEIYSYDGHFYDAHKMANIHVEEKHGSMLNYLMNMNPSFLGLSKLQHSILKLMTEGLSDKEIAAQKGISYSTVRNYRFKLHEHEKQSKLFLATMELLHKKEEAMKSENDATEFYDAHKTATMVDDRYDVTIEEKKKILSRYFDKSGAVKQFPSKEKAKIVVLREIAAKFLPGVHYSEIEINNALKEIYHDFPYIRRLLIEYGFFCRTDSGSEYWLKE
jgi:hypothetical protein